MKLIRGQMTRFVEFIKKREDVRRRKEDGQPRPWTKDRILDTFRFCNVRREDDRVTRWIAKNWRWPNHDHGNLFFVMAVARLVNWPDTLAEIGTSAMITGKLRQFTGVMKRRQAAGLKVFGGAYIVSTNGHAMNKADYLAEFVLEPLWRNRDFLRPSDGDTLAAFSERLQSMNGFKGFMAGQVVADLKYAKGCPLHDAPDWSTWAVSGPGSRRGLNRLTGRELGAGWKEAEWLALVGELREFVNLSDAIPDIEPVLHAQDVQNCLCEFDKYERVRLGQGQPRALYRSHGEG